MLRLCLPLAGDIQSLALGAGTVQLPRCCAAHRLEMPEAGQTRSQHPGRAALLLSIRQCPISPADEELLVSQLRDRAHQPNRKDMT